MRFEKSCGTVIFRKARGKYAVLLIKNRYTDFWSFPKGHVEAGENEYQTAIRETQNLAGYGVSSKHRCGSIGNVHGASGVCGSSLIEETHRTHKLRGKGADYGRPLFGS